MKIEGLALHCLSIPFVQGFQHATKDRHASDAIIVEVRSGEHRGYGEALPREYVTGESTQSVATHLTKHVWPRLARAELRVASPETLLEDVARCLDVTELGFLLGDPSARVIAHHAARSGLEGHGQLRLDGLEPRPVTSVAGALGGRRQIVVVGHRMSSRQSSQRQPFTIKGLGTKCASGATTRG